MQNKGAITLLTIALALVSLYQLSFTWKTNRVEKVAREYAQGDPVKEKVYLDSIANKEVYNFLGIAQYTYKECKELELNLGLDLRGGMNVTMEVDVVDVVRSLANYSQDEAFNQALQEAVKMRTSSPKDFVTLFGEAFERIAPNAQLASPNIFGTVELKDKIKIGASNKEVLDVIRQEAEGAIDNTFHILRTRIDRFGVVQPNIQSLEDKMGRIMVELPGIKEPERVRKLLQGSANLEFWETYTAKEVLPAMQSADAKLRAVLAQETGADSTAVDSTKEAPLAEATPAKKSVSAADSLAAALKGDATTTEDNSTANLAEIKKQYPLLAILQLNSSGQGPVIGYANYKDTADINKYLAMPEVKAELPKDLRLKWGVSPSEFDKKGQTFELYAIKSTERNGKAPLEGDVVTDAKDEFDQYSKPAVSMTMNSDGARRWAQLTKQNIGRSIAIVLDNYVYSAPNVNSEITGGRSQITGHFTPEQAKDLANVLKSGKMPAPAHIVQEDIVGPSLGQESINAGVFSFVVALILLMIYMCMMYGFIPGMIANGALFLNFFFVLGVLSSFQAALTMSGIAGMVLSLGMAVDANVLIYERTKEELRAGKGVKKALADGYSNAFSAIFDSNLTSIITGIILFNFGTGPIRGFATTLIIGILVSFFTAVFMTRIVYEHFMNKDKLLNLTFTTPVSRNLMTNTRFDFMGTNKKSLIITVAIILVCIGSFAMRGLSQSIDFTGGRNFKVQFENPVEPEQIRELISSKFGDANVSVIAIGTDKKTVRISTNYRIEDAGNDVDSQIEAYLYETLKPVLTQNITLATFIDRDNHTGGSIVSSQKVGPSIADDIKTGAIYSVVLALIAIGLYILIRFRNIAYSIGSIVALSCDTIMIIGAYSLLWGIVPFSLEIDQTFIGAILTAIGYSINDKVVIFDRVREFFGLYPKRDKRQLFNDSLNTTLARTINTSLSTLIVLLCIFILGGDSIRSFAFAMILGASSEHSVEAFSIDY